MAATDDTGKTVLMYGALFAGGYLFILKPLIGMLGTSPEDAATIQNQEKVPPSLNSFNPQFQPLVDSWNENNPTVSLGSYMQGLKAKYDDNSPLNSGDPNVDVIVNGAEAIHDALSWHHISTDGAAIVGVFSQLKYQQQVASMAAYFYYNFGKDLFNALQGSLFKAGLNGSDLAQVIAYVNLLPVSG